MSESSTATEPKFLIHQATHLFLTDPIHFQITQMNKSVLIWVGKSAGQLGDMSVAVPPFGSTVKHLKDNCILAYSILIQNPFWLFDRQALQQQLL